MMTEPYRPSKSRVIESFLLCFISTSRFSLYEESLEVCNDVVFFFLDSLHVPHCVLNISETEANCTTTWNLTFLGGGGRIVMFIFNDYIDLLRLCFLVTPLNNDGT